MQQIKMIAKIVSKRENSKLLHTIVNCVYVWTIILNILVLLFVVDAENESPTSLLWTFYYLAQHFDHLSQFDKALEYINMALDHTMTLIELYVVKAKIYKVCDHMKRLILINNYWISFITFLTRCLEWQLKFICCTEENVLFVLGIILFCLTNFFSCFVFQMLYLKIFILFLCTK